MILLSCSYYSKSLEVPPPLGEYEVIQTVRVNRPGFRFFYIPVTMPSAREIVAEQVALAGGDAAINVEVTFSEALALFPLSFPIVEVRCDIIRYGTRPDRPAPLEPEKPKDKKRRGLLDG